MFAHNLNVINFSIGLIHTSLTFSWPQIGLFFFSHSLRHAFGHKLRLSHRPTFQKSNTTKNTTQQPNGMKDFRMPALFCCFISRCSTHQNAIWLLPIFSTYKPIFLDRKAHVFTLVVTIAFRNVHIRDFIKSNNYFAFAKTLKSEKKNKIKQMEDNGASRECVVAFFVFASTNRIMDITDCWHKFITM